MKKITFLFIFIFSTILSFSCTTFIINVNGNLVFGRNLDWVSDNGLVIVNQRDVKKTSLVFPPEKPIEWVSKYGSITFNQFGKEFPFGGINEKGLVVEIMLAPADYPNFDNRKSINELQWVQYQLDNCKTIDEIIKSDKFLRISEIAEDLHFLICDSSGNAAAIEFKDGKMLVYRDDNLPYPVLENDTYYWSLSNLKNNIDCRFATTIEMIENYKKSNQNIIDYSFEILDKVALNKMWSIVYDIKNMQIYFKTISNPNIQIIDVLKFDFSCSNKTKMYDLFNRKKGNITNSFVKFSSFKNYNKLKNAIKTNEIQIPKIVVYKFYNYHKKCKCVKN